jgi:Uma2 family endonuclease
MMDWSSVINNPFLKDLPFKIELDKWGRILMSPASNNHGSLQFETGAKIRDAKKGKGKVITECSIQTSQGVRVADVAWASDAFIERFGFETPYRRAPEICVEVVSASNAQGEIAEKIELYLGKGAREVWIVSEDGNTKYYTYEGEMELSEEIGS